MIVEGAGIAGIRLGMPVAQALAGAGRVLGQIERRDEVTYLLAGPITQVTAVRGRVDRVATRDGRCATARGIRVGDPEARVQAAYARAAGVLRARAGALVRLLYPRDGIAFVFQQGRVAQIEVFRPEPPPAAQPAPSPVLDSIVVTISVRADGSALVVGGRVVRRDPPIALFAEVEALTAGGRVVGTGSVPLYPNPVGAGRAATFEERIETTDVPAAVAVTIRPMNRPTVALARVVQEIRDVEQFAPLVERLLEVTVLPAGIDQPGGTVAAVTNQSGLRITRAVIELELRTTCTVRKADGTLQTFVDARRGTVTVANLNPGGRTEEPINLQMAGPCRGVSNPWTATWRVTSISVASPE